jgi:hypothetical protein
MRASLRHSREGGNPVFVPNRTDLATLHENRIPAFAGMTVVGMGVLNESLEKP